MALFQKRTRNERSKASTPSIVCWRACSTTLVPRGVGSRAEGSGATRWVLSSSPTDLCDLGLKNGPPQDTPPRGMESVSYTHLRAHETPEHLVCRLLLEKKKT